MRNTAIKYFWLVLVLPLWVSCKQEVKNEISILPKPQQIQALSDFFTLNEQTEIVTDNENLKKDAAIFNLFLQQYYGFSLKISEDVSKSKNNILLTTSTDVALPEDGYYLRIHKKRLRIEGKGAGVFFGLQSIKQLLPVQKSDNIKIPCCEVTDYPFFQYRGMHLDVCRHFFTVGEVKKYIDYLAMYKMNIFHWHLTEDQGWRIQIDKYPKLTTVGAYRSGTLIGHYTRENQKFDTIRYGGFYTKDEIRDVVQYAADRHITVVPEIELPGHAMAALASYPEFSCTGGPFETARLWGVFEDVYCTKDETISFLKDILSEVVELFPGKYFHVGGDECPKTRWQSCPKCQAVIKREGLKDEYELQSYVVQTIEKFLNEKGKILIGWNEILEGGLAPNAVVMSWQGEKGGIAAARQHHYVVMCPGTHCYFDHYQANPKTEPLAIGGYTTLGKVYSYNPLPDSLTPEQKKYILGAQGNVWTEYIPDFKKVEYMAIPRMIALSEVLWLEATKKDSTDFKTRLQHHLPMLDKLQVNYANVK